MRSRLTVWAFVFILAAIPVLGYVQWRWIERATDAELEREKQRLDSALERIAAECNAEITRAHMFFFADPREPETDTLARLLADWKARAPAPGIVRELAILNPEEQTAVRINGNGDSQPYPDAPTLTGRRPLGIWDGNPALFMPMGGPGDFQGPGGGRGIMFRAPGPGTPPPPPVWPPRVRIVVLDTRTLADRFLPRLLERHLGSGMYNVAVRGPQGIVHGADVKSPDAVGSVIAVDPECLFPPNPGGQVMRGPGGPWRLWQRDMLTMPARPCSRSLQDGLWRIELQHSSGSLAHAMQSVRTQNLSLSFSVLALLTGAVIALWLSISRARLLAQRQVEFAMSVSHELRTPLTVMRLAGDNLASGMTISSEQAKRYGETIRAQAERLGNMVDQVLTFARSERPDWQVRTDTVRPEAVLHTSLAAAEGVIRESGCTLESEAEPNLPDIEADANLMTSAVSNLLVNAARYGSSGHWIRARVFADDGGVVFEVADRGHGIPQRDVRRVFQPFYRGRNSGGSRGAGLGLHLVRRIAKAHGGNVSIDSSVGVGTTVRIQLPISRRKGENAGEAASADRRG